MKLKEALKNHMGEHVKLGSSASFVFCGMADENIFDKIENLSQREFRKRSSMIETRSRRGHLHFARKWAEKLNNGLRNIRYEAMVNGWTQEQKDAKTKDFIESYERLKERDRQRMESGADLIEYRKSWVPFLERKVKDVYESIENENGVIIIFAGSELGEYWTEEEYERGIDNDTDIL